MTDYAVGTRKQAEAIQAEDAKRAGLPRRSLRRTPGYHVPAATEPGAPGWTTHVHGLREHPTIRDRFAYPVATEGRAELGARLPHEERALVLAAAPLGKDWTSPGLDALAKE